jgi:pilus assembly protein Flp/PilA
MPHGEVDPTSLRAERGATAVEYALMVAGVAMLILLAVFAFGDAVRDMFEYAVTVLVDAFSG